MEEYEVIPTDYAEEDLTFGDVALLSVLVIPVTLVIGVIFGICAVFSLMYETWRVLVLDD